MFCVSVKKMTWNRGAIQLGCQIETTFNCMIAAFCWVEDIGLTRTKNILLG